MKKLIFVLLWAVYGCCQTSPLYTHLSWDYDYTNEAGQEIDSTDIEFVIYSSANGTNFSEYTSTQELQYYTLQDETLYNDVTWHWYLRAHKISTDVFSASSDTVSAFYRKILPGKTYNLEILSIGVE